PSRGRERGAQLTSGYRRLTAFGIFWHRAVYRLSRGTQWQYLNPPFWQWTVYRLCQKFSPGGVTFGSQSSNGYAFESIDYAGPSFGYASASFAYSRAVFRLTKSHVSG